jgi:Predicted Zn-dependent protease (DUF2268)
MKNKLMLGVLVKGLFIGVLVSTIVGGATADHSPSAGPVIHIEDVDRFYKVYDAAGAHPTADQLQHDYLDAGSDGLHQFAKMRNITGSRIAETLAKRPQIYADAKHCTTVLPHVRERLQEVFGKLSTLYPEAKFPPVTIASGRGKPVGVGSPAVGVMIGLEALCATSWLNPSVEDRFVRVIAHEYVHVQQVPALVDDQHPTVLEGSLVEGAADFVAELISGGVSYAYFPGLIKGREKEIETAFVADKDKKDLSKWLYNSTPEKPADLGYWVGYRIVKSYYLHAVDKRQAIREILQMTDPNAFLAKSRWYPGIRLQEGESEHIDLTRHGMNTR